MNQIDNNVKYNVMRLAVLMGATKFSAPHPASIFSLPTAKVPLSCLPVSSTTSRNHGAMDRHEYHSRSRSADQRPAIERPTSRSRSTERPHDSSLMRSMPSLPSGRSAPPSPALTRCDPDRRG